MYALTKNKETNGARSADPFALLARDFFGFDPFTASRSAQTQLRRPAFDFIETPDGYTLLGDLPGVRDEDLDVTVHEGVLVIKGSYAEEEFTEGTSFLVRERRSGEFERQLKLPKYADPAKVEAKLANGVLKISIAKKEEIKARKIEIG
jgi:HSP20 family protein